MRKFLLIVILSLFSVALMAQSKNPAATANDTTIYSTTEVTANFPGGIQNLYNYVTTNLKANGNKGRVFLSFIVEKDGSLTHIKTERSLSESADKEAIRVMSGSPKWTPAMHNGNPVRERFTLPISFN